MSGRNLVGDYRYNYQGQELDQETEKVAFELRLYDSRINRWLTTDPAAQYNSPYLAMGNNWMNKIDPNGGFDWYVNNETGELEWHKGSASIDGLTWVGTDAASTSYLSSISKTFGGSGKIDSFDWLRAKANAIKTGFNNGLEQRGKDFSAFIADPVGRTLQGIANTFDAGGAFISDFVASGESDLGFFAMSRAYDTASNMTLYDWSYAAGYNIPDIALGYAGGYALSGVRGLGYGLNLRYYPNASGIGLNVTRNSQRILGLDWHRFKIGGRKTGRFINRPHIDIPGKGVKHWPWHQLDKWKRGMN